MIRSKHQVPVTPSGRESVHSGQDDYVATPEQCESPSIHQGHGSNDGLHVGGGEIHGGSGGGKLIADYETLIDELLATLSAQNHALAIKLASIPDDIRGYGHVKDAHLAKAKNKEADLLHQWRNPEAMKAAAE